MKAKEVMTKNVIAVKEEDTIDDVIKILLSNKISGVPVVNEENEVIGVVSEADLIFRDKEIEIPAFIPVMEGYIFLQSVKKYEEQLKKQVAYKVKDVMSAPVITAKEDEEIEKIANIMLKKRINRIPIVDKEGKLVGLITRSDILKTF